MSDPRTRGAFLAGLVRAEDVRQRRRWARRRRGERGVEYPPINGNTGKFSLKG